MKFNKNGSLDPGIHTMIWDDFHAFFSFSPRRKELLVGLKKVMNMLSELKCIAIYIDGSFVTDELEPNDVDVCIDIIPKNQSNFLSLIYSAITDFEVDLFFANNEADEYRTLYLDYFQQMKDNSAKKKGIIKLKFATL
ncbi:hypothetical protein FACS189421_00270 [Bacteroidia bacterium]|nr:hypothetical protein FACS189421_00270 [Bacteroidia bacterium]GHT47509.1 hypothetical protein FACS189440_08240 [Bacteroidia bacterium]